MFWSIINFHVLGKKRLQKKHKNYFKFRKSFQDWMQIWAMMLVSYGVILKLPVLSWLKQSNQLKTEFLKFYLNYFVYLENVMPRQKKNLLKQSSFCSTRKNERIFWLNICVPSLNKTSYEKRTGLRIWWYNWMSRIT